MRRLGVKSALTTLGLAAVAATAVLTAAGAAQAQSQAQAQAQSPLMRSRAPAVTLSEAQASSDRTAEAPAPRRALRWNDSGRWGLNFNLNEPVGREADWGDVEAGAYYRLSPSLRVGAAAGLAAPETDPARAAQTDRRAQPRVRLETIFKF